MRDRLTKSNDDQLPTRAELESANRELQASLKKCEALVADCRDKLAAAHEVKTDLTKR
jgi:cellobiose-specific phosphotransferase system component IIA